MLDDIQRTCCYVKTKLYELDSWPVGVNRSIESRRCRLEAQLDSLNRETHEGRVQLWQDVEELRREWRTWFKQYLDLVQRSRIVGVNFLPRPEAPSGLARLTFRSDMVNHLLRLSAFHPATDEPTDKWQE